MSVFKRALMVSAVLHGCLLPALLLHMTRPIASQGAHLADLSVVMVGRQTPAVSSVAQTTPPAAAEKVPDSRADADRAAPTADAEPKLAPVASVGEKAEHAQNDRHDAGDVIAVTAAPDPFQPLQQPNVGIPGVPVPRQIAKPTIVGADAPTTADNEPFGVPVAIEGVSPTPLPPNEFRIAVLVDDRGEVRQAVVQTHSQTHPDWDFLAAQSFLGKQFKLDPPLGVGQVKWFGIRLRHLEADSSSALLP